MNPTPILVRISPDPGCIEVDPIPTPAVNKSPPEKSRPVKFTSPSTSSLYSGFVVPIPTKGVVVVVIAILLVVSSTT